ncbi:hypothetical protein V5799_008807 [Amblyomma americanum]|uniref:Uncharacterized protein n=1 Tax=Amblyomma americanum TaxID=6943 RepID=A0AAQ4FCD5_AMBAM
MRSNVMLGLGSSVSDLWGLRLNTVMMSVVLFTGLLALVRDGLPKMRHSLYFLAAAKCSLLVGLFLGTIFREGAFRGIGQLPIWKLESFASLPAGPYIEVLVTEYLYHVVGFANIIGELLVVFQLYGLERVVIDCGLMLEKTPGRILQVLWSSVTPMLLTDGDPDDVNKRFNLQKPMRF